MHIIPAIVTVPALCQVPTGGGVGAPDKTVKVIHLIHVVVRLNQTSKLYSYFCLKNFHPLLLQLNNSYLGMFLSAGIKQLN